MLLLLFFFERAEMLLFLLMSVETNMRISEARCFFSLTSVETNTYVHYHSLIKMTGAGRFDFYSSVVELCGSSTTQCCNRKVCSAEVNSHVRTELIKNSLIKKKKKKN